MHFFKFQAYNKSPGLTMKPPEILVTVRVTSMLTSGTQVCGFQPSRSRWIFTGVKILSMPSSGGEVKESVQCPSFAACKTT